MNNTYRPITLWFILCLFLLPQLSHGQIAASVDPLWRFGKNDVSGASNNIACFGCVYVAGTALAATRKGGTLSTETGLNCAPTGDYVLKSGDWPATFNFNDDYLEFTFNAAPSSDGDCYLNYEGIGFTYSRAADGPDKLAVYYSRNNDDFSLLQCDFSIDDSSCEQFIEALHINGIRDGRFRIRIYAYGGNGDFWVDDVRLFTTITCPKLCTGGLVPPPTDGEVLPVSLKSFDGYPYGKANRLEWSTETEKDNDFFAIERSVDGRQFEEIGRLNSEGDSNGERSYFFDDKQPLSGTAYYRLRQVDLNGMQVIYGPLAITSRGFSGSDMSIYPNPVNDLLYLNLGVAGESSQVRIFDVSGQEVARQPLSNKQSQHTILTGQLRPGTYIIRVDTDRETLTQRFVKQ